MNFKLAFIAAAFVLAGCSTTPVVAPKFPSTSAILTTPCPPLDKVPEGTTKLSELEKVVAANYTKYHQCANQINGWNVWYNKEQQNYESTKTK
jgi:hypothetical protein